MRQCQVSRVGQCEGETDLIHLAKELDLMTKSRPAEISKITSGNAVGKATEVSRRMHLPRSVLEDMQALGAAPKTRLDALVALGLTDEDIAAHLSIPVQSVRKLRDVWSIHGQLPERIEKSGSAADASATAWTEPAPVVEWRKYA